MSGVFWDAARGAHRVPLPRGIGNRGLPPHHTEVVDVPGVDLIERGVLGAGLVGRVRAPFARLAGRARHSRPGGE